MDVMIYWILRKLGLVAASEVPFEVSSDDSDDIPDDYELVPAPITKKPRTSRLVQLMSHFLPRLQEIRLPQTPVLHRSILNDYSKEFFKNLERIIGNPPVNQTSPTLSDMELLPLAKKKKTFHHLKPVDAPIGNRNAFSDVLSQIKAINKTEMPESGAPSVKLSDTRISQRIAITQGLFQIKVDHFGGSVQEQKMIDEPVIEGEFAPMAPPLITEEPMLSETPIPRAPAFR
jgi:hypothetical protein